MRRRTAALAGVGAILLVLLAYALPPLLSGPELPFLDVGKDFPARNPQDDEAGLCPWRQPDADRTRFFPGSSGVRDETLILTRQRAAIARLLGRQATGQENAIQIHRVLRRARTGEQVVGTIVTRCVSGESGVMELVLAVDLQERVRGARIQRLREPDAVAHELQSSRFLGAFQGKTLAAQWKTSSDFPAVSAPARLSADALLDGARTALILLHIGERITDHH
jgi:hypothetical protein